MTPKAVTPEVLAARLEGPGELAVLDLREEGLLALKRLFRASPLPACRMELLIDALVPRRSAPVVLTDLDGTAAEEGALRLARLGWEDVGWLRGGTLAWEGAGLATFVDQNLASKAFGEIVERRLGTPGITARDLMDRLARGDDLVVLDARTRAEFMDFSIPGAHSVPGCELAWRAAAYAPDPSTAIVVNCAGRTRSIIGAQTLVQAGLPNPVAALRDGTIAWILGGGRLEVGPSPEKIERARLRDGLPESRAAVRGRVRDWAARLPIKVVDEPALRRLRRSRGRTVYLFDVRTAHEYEGGHPPGFRHAPGGQLVQAADRFMGVMGAAVVLADLDGVRAWTTAAWLAQMGAWEVLVHPVPRTAALEAGPERRTILCDPLSGPAAMVTPHGARRLMAQGAPVADVESSLDFIRGHVPGAKFVAPPRLGWFGANFAPGGRNAQDAPDGPNGRNGPDAPPIVLTSGDGLLAASLAGRLNGGTAGRRFVAVTGGTRAWAAEGLPLETGGEGILTGEEDVRRSACEYGQGLVREALGEDRGGYDQRFVDYLAWEVDLVNQLGRPGVKADFRLAAP